MDIHERIKKARQAKGLSMEQLAAAIGLKSWQTIQQWENGKTAPNRRRAPAVAEVLGISLEELTVGGAESKEWPFKLISEAKVRALTDKQLAMLEVTIAMDAEKFGLDISADIIDGEGAVRGESDQSAYGR